MQRGQQCYALYYTAMLHTLQRCHRPVIRLMANTDALYTHLVSAVYVRRLVAHKERILKLCIINVTLLLSYIGIHFMQSLLIAFHCVGPFLLLREQEVAVFLHLVEFEDHILFQLYDVSEQRLLAEVDREVVVFVRVLQL